MKTPRALSALHRWPIFAALVVAAVLLAGCQQKKQSRETAQPPVPVTVAKVIQKNEPVEVKAIGTVEPYSSVQVKSLVEGQVVGVHFKEGQDVRKGQLLFTIDKAPFEAALKQAESTLAQDIAQMKDAQAQAQRYAELQKQGVVAKQQADTMISAADAKQALVAADRAAVEQARLRLQYCNIYAPISGRTGNLMIYEGNLVKVNADTPMVTINQISPIFGTFSVPEQYLADIKKRSGKNSLPVRAELPNDPVPVRGTLSFVDNTVDPATGQIKLKGTFANAERRLWPGQYVNMVLTLATQPNAIVIPSAALQTGQQGEFVFVIKPDKTAEQRLVKVARVTGNKQVVISSGVQPGETVVTDGQLRLVSGARVDIKEVNASAVQPSVPPAENEPPVNAKDFKNAADDASSTDASSSTARAARQEGQ